MIPPEAHSYTCYRYMVDRNGRFDYGRKFIVLRKGPTLPFAPSPRPTTNERGQIRDIATNIHRHGTVIPYRYLCDALDTFATMPDGYQWFLDEFNPYSGHLRRFVVTKDQSDSDGYRLDVTQTTLP